MDESFRGEVDEFFDFDRRGLVRDTSLAAYREIMANGRLKSWTKTVYEILYYGGPLTTGELLQICEKKLGTTDYKILNNYQKCIYSLRDREAVKEVGERVCKACPKGRERITFDVTRWGLQRANPTRTWRKITQQVHHELFLYKSYLKVKHPKIYEEVKKFVDMRMERDEYPVLEKEEALFCNPYDEVKSEPIQKGISEGKAVFTPDEVGMVI